MSDTPSTDALLNEMVAIHWMDMVSSGFVDHARRLERENNRLQSAFNEVARDAEQLAAKARSAMREAYELGYEAGYNHGESDGRDYS